MLFRSAPSITTLPAEPATLDTTPTTVLGTVQSIGADPQTTLSTAFPSATNSQGIQDLATDEFWTYTVGVRTWAIGGWDSLPWNAGEFWKNVGTTPGPTMTTTSVVPVWNETLKADGRIRIGIDVSSLGYALNLQTQPSAMRLKIGLGVTSVLS